MTSFMKFTKGDAIVDVKGVDFDYPLDGAKETTVSVDMEVTRAGKTVSIGREITVDTDLIPVVQSTDSAPLKKHLKDTLDI